MTEQEIYVINSLSGKPMADVIMIGHLLPDLIKAVEESGWIKIEDDNQPPNDVLVRVWNKTFNQEISGKYIRQYSVNTQDAHFEGDTEYNEEDDETYWPEGWYVFCEHAGVDYAYGLCLDEITHFKYIVAPSFISEK